VQRAYWQASQLSGFSREQATASWSLTFAAAAPLSVWRMRVAGRERR
jgi:hypothetical protein